MAHHPQLGNCCLKVAGLLDELRSSVLRPMPLVVMTFRHRHPAMMGAIFLMVLAIIVANERVGGRGRIRDCCHYNVLHIIVALMNILHKPWSFRMNNVPSTRGSSHPLHHSLQTCAIFAAAMSETLHHNPATSESAIQCEPPIQRYPPCCLTQSNPAGQRPAAIIFSFFAFSSRLLFSSSTI